MGKDKERLTPDGKRLGRMEMIAVGTASVLGPECFVQPPPKTPNQAQTKKSQDQELPRKHISSHSQVAKKKFYVEADDPKFWNDQDWVDKDSEEHKNVKRIGRLTFPQANLRSLRLNIDLLSPVVAGCLRGQAPRA